MEVPDALSRMRAEVAAQRARTVALAEKYRPTGTMEDIEVDPALWGEIDEPPSTAAGTAGEVKASPELEERARAAYGSNDRISALIRNLEEHGE